MKPPPKRSSKLTTSGYATEDDYSLLFEAAEGRNRLSHIDDA
jgi:hypothetical protein